MTIITIITTLYNNILPLNAAFHPEISQSCLQPIKQIRHGPHLTLPEKVPTSCSETQQLY